MRVGVIGGAGYTAGELLRLLVNHPAAEIAFVHSDSNAGNALGDVHGGLLGETDLRFTAEYDLGAIDVLFLCSAHGRSREFLAANALPEGLRIIDLAQQKIEGSTDKSAFNQKTDTRGHFNKEIL